MTKPLITIQRTNTILYCKNWVETVHFYKEMLRLPVSFENDWFIEFQQTGDSFLSIADSTRATILDVQGQGATITWQVTNLEEVQAQLEAQGISTTTIQHKWDGLVCYSHDPEGHRLEFWQEGGQPG